MSKNVFIFIFVFTFYTSFGSGVYLSFIIPCYNRGYIIHEAINSIYRQKLFFDFEVICVDDGSTDDTLVVLESYNKKYSNFKVYTHQTNQGASQARNTGIKHAQGKLLFNLDSDNVLENGSIQRLVDFMHKKGTQAAAFAQVKHFRLCNKMYWIEGIETYIHKDNIFDIRTMFLSSKSPGASGNYLFTKESYDRAGGYTGEGQETWVFCFKQLATGTTFAILPNSYYWHRVSPDSYWWILEGKGLNDKHCLETVKQFPKLFTPETNQLLQKYDLSHTRFFDALNAHQLRVRLVSELKSEGVFDYYSAS